MQRTIITESRKQLTLTGELSAEDKLALLASIVESSEDAIVSKTLEGIVTSWNQGAERIFGYTASEIIGLPITVLIPMDRLDEEPKIIERLKRGERVDHFETVRRKKNGDLIHISLTISPIRNAQNQVIGASKIARDITEIKALERRKDDFIHMASHELKTPITSVKGYVQLLSHILSQEKFKSFKDDEPQFCSALNAVNKQVDKMITLISELLDLSRIEFGKLEMHRSTFNLEEFVEEVVSEVRHTTRSHEIFVDTKYKGMISADRDRLSQVLVNLLTNAVKYSPGADRVEVKVDSDPMYARISVKDYGIGIDAKEHRLIFDRFYRVEGNDGKGFPGFGIGLYVTAEIVQLHNGIISVESEKGKGAIFTVTLPLK